MQNHNAGRGQLCHMMGPQAPKGRKLVTSLSTIKLNAKVLLGTSFLMRQSLWDLERAGVFSVRAHPKQRRPSCKVARSLTLEMFRELEIPIKWMSWRLDYTVFKVPSNYKVL